MMNSEKSATEKPIIVVLDDMIERVRWLKDHVGNRAEIMWSKRVSKFLDYVKKAESTGRLILVILDHDLDIWSNKNDSLDDEGQTGMDAAKQLNLSRKDIPVLVWSMNDKASVEMENLLWKRGFLVTRMPFHNNRQNGQTITMHIANYYQDNL